jgi:phosphoribosyl-ATP pyrophosphohydrolase
MRCSRRARKASRPHWCRHSPACDLQTAAEAPAAAAGEVTLMPVLPRISAPVNRFGVRIEYGARMTDSVARLYEAVIAVRGSDPAKSRTARLLRAGRAKMAKKLAEEAVEVVIDAMHGQPEAVVRESADLLYNLVVLWVHAGVHPDDVWAEMRRREVMFGIAEKVPKDLVRPPQRRKVVALDGGRTRKRR